MSAANFFQRAGQVSKTRPIGFIGTSLGTVYGARGYTGNNQRPLTTQVSTVTIPASPTASATYGLTAYGLTASYTADASATQDEVGAGLAAAWNAVPGLRRLAIATYTGGTLTLTGTVGGVAFDNPTGSGGSGGGALGNASTSTGSAEAARVYFARVLATDGYVTDEGTPKVFQPTTSLFSAQLKTFTYSSIASGDSVLTRVKMNGAEVVESTPFNSSHAQTLIDHAANLETKFNATFGAGYGCAAARSGDTVTITADVPGAEFSANTDVIGTGGGAVTSSVDTTGPSISTSLQRAFAGLSRRRLDVENATIDGDDPSYAPRANVEVASYDALYVQRDTSETWGLSDACWVDVSTTIATASGRIYNTGAANRVYLGRDLIRIQRQEPSSQSNGVGVVRVLDTAIGA